MRHRDSVVIGPVPVEETFEDYKGAPLTPQLAGPGLSHYLALACSVLLTTCGQLILRTGARHRERVVHSVLNRFTSVGYSLFGLGTVLAVYALQAVDMSKLFWDNKVMAGSGYALTLSNASWICALVVDNIYPAITFASDEYQALPDLLKHLSQLFNGIYYGGHHTESQTQGGYDNRRYLGYRNGTGDYPA